MQIVQKYFRQSCLQITSLVQQLILLLSYIVKMILKQFILTLETFDALL